MAKVTITETPTDPALLEKLRGLAPPPPPGVAPPVVITPAERLTRAEREHSTAREALIDESEIQARIDRHTRACNDAEEQIKIHLEEIKILRQKASSELAELQGARALRVDNAQAVAARTRFDRATEELEAARAAVAEQQAQEAARAAVERSTREKAADHQEGQGGGAQATTQGGPQATSGGGAGSGSEAAQATQGGPETQGGAQASGGGQAPGQAPAEQQGGQVGPGQAGAP